MAPTLLDTREQQSSFVNGAEAAVLKARLAQLEAEVLEAKQDKRAFRDASEDARKNLLRMREENRDLRRRLQVQKEGKARDVVKVDKGVQAVSASSCDEENHESSTSMFASILEGSARSYPSPAESDGEIMAGGEHEQSPEIDEASQGTVDVPEKRKRHVDDEIVAPRKKANTQALQRQSNPHEPLELVEAGEAKELLAENPSLAPESDRAQQAMDDASDPRIRRKAPEEPITSRETPQSVPLPNGTEESLPAVRRVALRERLSPQWKTGTILFGGHSIAPPVDGEYWGWGWEMDGSSLEHGRGPSKCKKDRQSLRKKGKKYDQKRDPTPGTSF